MQRTRRQSRTIASKAWSKHKLVMSIAGRGRRPGDYVCSCAERFTSIHDYETHRAEGNRVKASA